MLTCSRVDGVRGGLFVPAVGDELARSDAVHDDGTVQIHSGLAWFDTPTAQQLVGLSREEPVVSRGPGHGGRRACGLEPRHW